MSKSENDIYFGDLMLVKKRVTAWSEKHPRGNINLIGKVIIAILCLGAIVTAYHFDPNGSTQRLSPLTITIFFSFVIAIFAARGINKLTQPPFAKLYNVRFEASTRSIICYYQQGMTEFLYEIKDKNIKEWIVDEDAWCFYFKGKGEISRNTKQGFERMSDVREFYMIIPFDEFEVDDLIAPYGDLVTRADGTLRKKVVDEKVTTPCIVDNPSYKEKTK